MIDGNNIIDDKYFSCSSDEEFCSIGSDDSPGLSLHDHINSIFTPVSKNFNLVHINAQSVPAHYTDLLTTFSGIPIDAILISESFLKPSLSSYQFSLPGFKLIRNDRIGKGGGGVAMYIRSEYSFKIVSLSPNPYSASAEYIFIELSLGYTKLLIAVFYSPSLLIDYFTTLDNLLNNLRPIYDHIILLGDFNTCLIKNDHRSNKLFDIISSVNLHILPLSPTHHFPNATPSLLDLMIVSHPERVSVHGQLPACFSYHDLIFLSYKVRTAKRRKAYVMRRCYRNLNLELLKSDVNSIDWSSVTDCSDINNKVFNFNNIILGLYNKHAPIKRTKLKHDPAPWITDDIKNFMRKRDKANRHYRKFPTVENLAIYKLLRNRCNQMCRHAKRRYIHETIVSSKSDSTKVWHLLRSLGVGGSTAPNVCSVDLNDLNAHFSCPPVVLDNVSKASTIANLAAKPLPLCPVFNFDPVNESDVKKHVLSISSAAIGSDGVCSRMILPILSELLPILTHIFNFSLSSSSFPAAWKMAYVIPHPKIPNASSPCHFRPISILPFLSKVLEHIVHFQLSNFLRSNCLLHPYQSGFRPGHSTVTALIRVTDDIRKAIDEKKLTILVLLDFSNAFNSVDFDVLIRVLASLNISSSALDWIRSYLENRSQSVISGELRSEWIDLYAGVPQGGVLSPLLFSSFINTITDIVTSKFHLYADDLQIYHHFSAANIEEAVHVINDELDNIFKWAKSFGLSVNPSKSQALILGSRPMKNLINNINIPTLMYNNMPIAFSSSASNLGITFNSDFSWNTHVNNLSRKVYHAFHSLKPLQNFLPVKTKTLLMHTLILPIIDYADSCYPDATEEVVNKLERLQNLCIRYIYGLRKFDHVSTFRAELQWLPIRLRRKTHILNLLYKILFNPLSPKYLRDSFNFLHSPDSPCRSNVRTLLRFPSSYSTAYSHSFTVHAVSLWNSLPSEIRLCQTFETFKKRVKDYFLTKL